MSEITEELIIGASHASNIFGQFDAYMKKIERTLQVEIILRDDRVRIVGEEVQVKRAKDVIEKLCALSERGNQITEQNVDYALSLSFENRVKDIVEIDKDIICHTINGKPIKPKTVGQQKYVQSIKDNMIVFGCGPAGPGKT